MMCRNVGHRSRNDATPHPRKRNASRSRNYTTPRPRKRNASRSRNDTTLRPRKRNASRSRSDTTLSPRKRNASRSRSDTTPRPRKRNASNARLRKPKTSLFNLFAGINWPRVKSRFHGRSDRRDQFRSSRCWHVCRTCIPQASERYCDVTVVW